MSTQSQRQQAIAEKLKKRRIELGMSQDQVARAVSELLGSEVFRQQSYAAVEAGRTKHSKFLPQIARVLGLSPESVDPLSNPPAGVEEAISQYGDRALVIGPAVRKLPVIGSVVAGAWCEAVDNFQPGDAEEWIDAPGPVGPNAFVLRIEGVSMCNPADPVSFNDGDKVVIDPSKEAKSGDYVVAKLTGSNSVTFKRLRQDSGEWYLEATNPDWKPRYIQINEEWQLCGRAMWKVQQL